MEKSPFIDTAAAARFLRKAPGTLENQRIKGGGPPYYKLGGRVFYTIEDLKTYAAQQRRRSTSDAGAAA